MTSGSSLPSDATQGLLGAFLTMSDSDTVPMALPDSVLAFWLGEGDYEDIPEDEQDLEWGEIASQEIRYLRKRVKDLETSGLETSGLETTQPTTQPSTQPPNTDNLARFLDLLEFGALATTGDYETRGILEDLAQRVRGMIR